MDVMTPKWRTKKGYYLEVTKMSDAHIKHTMNMLSSRTDQWSSDWYDIFDDELKRRKKAKTIREAEDKIELSFGDTTKPHVVLSLSRMPNNCFECPIQVEYEEDEPTWGDGIGHYCPYGGETWGSAVERPKGCPLRPGLNTPVIHEVDVN